MTNEPWVLQELQTALEHLAASGPEQVAYVHSLAAVSHDELALDFDAVAPVARALVERGSLTVEQAQTIAAVDEQLLAMSGEEHACLWTDEGLLHAPEWEEVRRLARLALALFGG